jgi:GxxExxY protein
MTEITQFPDLGARLSQQIIGAGIAVHRELGPGLLENIYEECMAIQMKKDGIAFERQQEISVVYDGVKLDLSYKADFIIEDKIIIELKAVEKILPIHEAQLLTYLKLSGKELGLLMNFNTVLLKEGVKRMALSGKS